MRKAELKEAIQALRGIDLADKETAIDALNRPRKVLPGWSSQALRESDGVLDGLASAFPWEDSPQEKFFWVRIHRALEREEGLPRPPAPRKSPSPREAYYSEDGKTCDEIAAEYCVTGQAVRSRAKKAGFELPMGRARGRRFTPAEVARIMDTPTKKRRA